MQLPNITLQDIDNAILRKRRNKFDTLFPDTGPLRRELYTKHVEFFHDGINFRERLFRAANRVGKSEAGAYEVTCHLTGRYPAWWTGKRFTRPTNVLVAGESGRLVRDSIQEKLVGPPSDVGTGMIPYDCIIERRAKSGIPDALDIVQVKHVNGISQLQFQSFDQGREAFQATARDVVWFDEEPPLAVYTEGLTRTMTTQGIVITTFTPLKGMSETVQFLDQKFRDHKISLVTASWANAPHLTEEDKADLLSAYPPHQRDARTQGIPALGSGAIYPIPESDIIIDDIALPKHWRRAYGMDVGWNRTAVIWGAYDDASDTLYLYSEHYRGQAEPSIHADAIKARGLWMHGVIDPASRGRSQKDGEQLYKNYQELGLRISPANNGVESGIFDVYQRLSSGRLKVFRSLVNWINEFRVYRRDDNGKIVKENDHLMDACVTGDTVVQTDQGPRQIASLVGCSGKVVTRCGATVDFIGARKTLSNAPIVELQFSNGDKIRCTYDHPFLTPSGWVKAIDMMGMDCYNGVTQRIHIRSCQQLIRSFLARPAKSLWASAITCAASIFNVMVSAYIALFGKRATTESLSQAAGISTILTVTGLTTNAPILRLSTVNNTYRTTNLGMVENHQAKQSKPPLHGTLAKQARLGISSTTKTLVTTFSHYASWFVNNVAKTTQRPIVELTASAPINASQSGATYLGLMMRNAAVWFAAKALWSIVTVLNKHAQASVMVRCHHVTGAGHEDVYCLTVPSCAAFCVGSGLVVHNTRYMCVSGIAVVSYAPEQVALITGGKPQQHSYEYDYDPRR